MPRDDTPHHVDGRDPPCHHLTMDLPGGGDTEVVAYANGQGPGGTEGLHLKRHLLQPRRQRQVVFPRLLTQGGERGGGGRCESSDAARRFRALWQDQVIVSLD
jgi:hypothetical protein